MPAWSMVNRVLAVPREAGEGDPPRSRVCSTSPLSMSTLTIAVPLATNATPSSTATCGAPSGRVTERQLRTGCAGSDTSTMCSPAPRCVAGDGGEPPSPVDVHATVEAGQVHRPRAGSAAPDRRGRRWRGRVRRWPRRPAGRSSRCPTPRPRAASAPMMPTGPATPSSGLPPAAISVKSSTPSPSVSTSPGALPMANSTSSGSPSPSVSGSVLARKTGSSDLGLAGLRRDIHRVGDEPADWVEHRHDGTLRRTPGRNCQCPRRRSPCAGPARPGPARPRNPCRSRAPTRCRPGPCRPRPGVSSGRSGSLGGDLDSGALEPGVLRIESRAKGERLARGQHEWVAGAEACRQARHAELACAAAHRDPGDGQRARADVPDRDEAGIGGCRIAEAGAAQVIVRHLEHEVAERRDAQAAQGNLDGTALAIALDPQDLRCRAGRRRVEAQGDGAGGEIGLEVVAVERREHERQRARPLDREPGPAPDQRDRWRW